jgi:hypothetical protein
MARETKETLAQWRATQKTLVANQIFERPRKRSKLNYTREA